MTHALRKTYRMGTARPIYDVAVYATFRSAKAARAFVRQATRTRKRR